MKLRTVATATLTAVSHEGNPVGASLSLWEKTGLSYHKAKGNALLRRNSPQ
ncbi:MAG: hypothetical protein V7L20_17980 [Nostoc sp.]|uniref:hypothetical protein n=1 Tax=Nostoc sp. TaxID=1180 RepID=UPI002FF65E18